MVQMKDKKDRKQEAGTSDFISHMVQMKGVKWISNNRWSWLYIPHGSDESRCPMVLVGEENPLYPTWFR